MSEGRSELRSRLSSEMFLVWESLLNPQSSICHSFKEKKLDSSIFYQLKIICSQRFFFFYCFTSSLGKVFTSRTILPDDE